MILFLKKLILKTKSGKIKPAKLPSMQRVFVFIAATIGAVILRMFPVIISFPHGIGSV